MYADVSVTSLLIARCRNYYSPVNTRLDFVNFGGFRGFRFLDTPFRSGLLVLFCKFMYMLFYLLIA